MALPKEKKIMCVKEDANKLEPFWNVDGNVKWCIHYKISTEIPQRIKKIELLYDLAILLLSTHLKELKARSPRGIYTHMFTTALLE